MAGDSNAVRMGYAKQTTADVTPDPIPLRRLRFNGAPDLAKVTTSEQSGEILDDGQLSDTFPVSFDIGGSTNHELSFEAHDDIIEGAVRNAFTAQNRRENKLTPDGPIDDNVAVVSSVYTFDTGTAFAADDIVFVQGFDTAANNGVKVLTAGDATSATAAGLVDEADATPAVGAERTIVACGRQYADLLTEAESGGQANIKRTADAAFTGLPNLPAGSWIWLGGFTDTDINTPVRLVNAVTAASIVLVVDHLPAGWSAEGAGEREIFFPELATNGTGRQLYILEMLFTDIGTSPTEERQRFTEMEVGSWTVTANADSVITHDFAFVGRAAAFAQADLTNQTRPEAATKTPMNASSNVAGIYENGTLFEGEANCPQTFSLTIENNVEKKAAVGKPGGCGFRRGKFLVTGTLPVFFDTRTLAEKVINNTETSIAMAVKDSTNHAYVFYVPRAKFTQGAPAVPGADDSVSVALNYEALKDATLAYTLGVNRFWATTI